MKITELEFATLHAIAESEYHDGRDIVGDPVWTFSVTERVPGFSPRQVGGTIGALNKKGLTGSQEESEAGENDAVVWITEAGADAYSALEKIK